MERSSPVTSTRWTLPGSRKALGTFLFALLCLVLASAVAQAQEPVPAGAALKVCADPNNLPQSDKAGAGYENKLAEALAKDLGRKLEYTYFPQRTGFVRQTLRSMDEQTKQFKCDVIIGVPKGYELTATTQPYMRSVYAVVMPPREGLPKLSSAEDLLKVPPETLRKLRVGIFAQTPATDWLLRNGMIDQARMYATQSGDPEEHPANIIERDLEAGNIDLAIVWGPVAGFLAERHKAGKAWISLPFQPDPLIKFDYEIAMGVRFGEKEWKDTLDRWISTHQQDIRTILTAHGVPLLDLAPTKVSSAADAGPPEAR